MSDAVPEVPKPSLNSLELLGALSARLVHSLSNHLSIMTGNLCVAARLRNEPDKIASALESALQSGKQAGNLLSSFVELHRTIKTNLAPCPIEELAESIVQWSNRRTGWKIEIDPDLKPRKGLAVPAPWPWLAFILNTIVDENQAATGGVRLICYSDMRRPFASPVAIHSPSTGAIRICLTYRSTTVIDWNEIRVAFKNYNLVASYELLQQMGGRVETFPNESGGQETRLTLPLIPVIPSK